MNIVGTVVVAILVFLMIILIHEFGHFVAAKSFGVLVHEFSIGFGPKIFRRKKGDTDYTVRLLPVGGYVKLEGEDESSEDPRALNNKPAWQRLVVMAAGAAFNLVTGFIVMIIFFSSQQNYVSLEIDKIMTEIPSSQAIELLKEGDRIVSLDGKKVWNYKDFNFLMSNIQGKENVLLEIVRDGEKQEIDIHLTEYEGRRIIGIEMLKKDMTFLDAVRCGFTETFFVVRLVIYSLMMLITGKVPVSQMSGPVGTTVIIGQAAQQGIFTLLYMFALLSVNIGIFNLIPFPALDGGRIFFLIIEMIRRKPLPPEKEGIIHFAGLILLLLLMLFVTSSDIYKLFA